MSDELAKQPENGFEQLPEWLVGIRRSMAQAIGTEKLKAVFDKQVEMAMNGDTKAAKFVFEQARAFSEIKGITLVQNVYHGTPPPAQPQHATARRGDPTPDEIAATTAALRPPPARVDNGNGQFRADGSRIRAH